MAAMLIPVPLVTLLESTTILNSKYVRRNDIFGNVTIDKINTAHLALNKLLIVIQISCVGRV